MMGYPSGDPYRTPQMERAERELDGRIDFALSKAREVQAKTEEVEQKLAQDTTPLTNAEVDRFKAYIEGHVKTPEWQAVLERIARGELTWRQIVEGVAEGELDRDVSAAMASLTRVPPANTAELTAIGVLPDMDKAAKAMRDAEAPEQGGSTESAPRARASEPADDDDWFEGGSIMR
ncbi:hypothetical protein EV191_10422 [Tamaricihabitans halophyticus]|uniref:Uncharacterized protein n=1 Tax=Tamaricihabitans halophyticus TaxID=1262583 RepID=A0A4R2R209_9PSEU|nr:hypothetical protein [Tamaricihabitans halophyticus]TCP53455.1 hypothetical protein EV191_10422 [Tamaricihabitans halophyticus]